MPVNLPFTITRTIYDPASKNFVFDSGEAKALPNIRDWINDHDPFIYWYILRIDNSTDTYISQWAVELYTHHALTISESYIEGFDRVFHLEKYRKDAYCKPYLLSITEDKGIPIVSKGTRRLYFKVDINCKEGLMHEYGISGMFMAHGLKEENIKEKKFKYSCKVGEFKHIFDCSPEEASIYAKKKLVGHYSPNSIEIFTNSFRKIHDLTRYCHSDKVIQGVLISKLQILQADFENVPEITGKRIIPLMQDEMDKLISLQNLSSLNPGILNLCDKLVEYLHSEVMEAEAKSFPQYSTTADHIQRKEPVINSIQKECPVCGNIITESNKSLICLKCRSKFCLTCEDWFREERKRGEKPLCEKCFDEEKEKEESRKKTEAESQKEQEERRKIWRLLIEEKETKTRLEEADTKKREEEREILRKASLEDIKKEIVRLEFKQQVEIMTEPKERELFDRISTLTDEFKRRKNQLENDEKRLPREEDERKERETKERIKVQDIRKHIPTGIGMKFTLIPAGEFMMGSNEYDWEKPIHKVKIYKPFYLGKYPVTQKEWKALMGTNPSNFKSDDKPVENVSWNDIQRFIETLNHKEDTNKYRLPSEAEWEYAARAGTTTRFSFGDFESNLGEYAWYKDNSGSKTHDAGQKKPNPWGLYDMHGNVWEWVHDKKHDNYFGAPTDGSAWESGNDSDRVSRSGSWNYGVVDCRPTARSRNAPGDSFSFIGFRLLRIL